MRRHGHSLNRTIVTEALWRELPAELRLVLRRVLKRKSAIVGRQVLDGQPLIPYQGCGFGLMMNLKELMGERGPDPAGTILV
jgi:hypothetical protein